MNSKIIKYYLAMVVKVEAACMILPFICSLFYKEKEGFLYLLLAISLFLCGTIITKKKPENTQYYRAESFVIVGLSWIILSLVGAIPFTVLGEIDNYFDSIFETISGFTTTGATIIDDLSLLSHTSLFWRSLIQFIGGMGVLVLMLTIVSSDSNNMMLMKAESPGPSVSRIKPHVKDTAKMLYIIYMVITFVCIACYFLSGMSMFDAICYGFTTAGTGGFATTNAGVKAFSPLTRNFITFFMLVYGINFNVYFLIAIGRAKEGLKSEELKMFLCTVFIITLIVICSSYKIFVNIGENIHVSLFTVSSMITTTGYNIIPYCDFADMSRHAMLIAMCIGSCAGSTAGGLKISRFMIIMKQVFKEINYQIHPQSIRLIKLEGKAVSDPIKKNANSYFIIYVLIIVVAVLVVSHQPEIEFETVILAVINAFNNIGVGLSSKGVEFNFNVFDYFSKFILMSLMLIGRLEIFPILILFHRKTWNRAL